jgi:uncharacterized protein YacL
MFIIRSLWSLFVAAVTLVGAIIGNYAGERLKNEYGITADGTDALRFSIGMNVAGGLVGFLFGVFAFRTLLQWAKNLDKVPLLDKMAAVLGVILGLSVALLASAPFATYTVLGVAIRIVACLAGILLGVRFAMSATEQIVFVFPALQSPRLGATATQRHQGAKMLDTNIIIDGRIADIAAAGFIEGEMLIPGFVLQELRHIADSADALKRARGRRGLEVLNKLKAALPERVQVFEDYPASADQREEVDARLVTLANAVGAIVVTNDYGVNEIAKLHGVPVMNVNELANAMKPVFLPGEDLMVTIVKSGKEPGQGVAYLDDGTMVVVERAARHIGQLVPASVTSVLQTTAGKMIFADLAGEENGKRKAP